MPPRPSASRRVVAGLLAASLLVACSGGDGGEDEDAASTSSSSAPSTTSTTRPADATPPSHALVAEGVSFGTAPPPLASALDALRPDEFIREADAAVAFDTASATRLADVVVIALHLDAFEGDAALIAYVDALEAGLPTARESIVTFRYKELLVALLGADRAALDDLSRGMTTALAAGKRGSSERSTPMKQAPVGSVFIDLESARFVAFADPAAPTTPAPQAGTPTTEGPPPAPEAPVLGGGGAVAVEARQVVVAGEVRATAWAMAVSLDVFTRAEDLEREIAALVAARAGEPTVRYIVDRNVWGADPSDDRLAVRAFRFRNIVVVVEAADAVQLDALVAEWVDGF